MQKSAPLYNYLIIFIPFVSFIIGNDAYTNLYQKIIVLSFGIILAFIFFLTTLMVNVFFPKNKEWIKSFLSISLYFAFSYAQWGLENELYLILFITVPILVSLLMWKINIVERFFSTFIYTMVAVISIQFTYLQLSENIFIEKGSSLEGSHLNESKLIINPNIYLVILDAYSREDSLQELGFDNSKFIKFLKSNKFYVADKSNANFISTRLSHFTLLMSEYPEPNTSLKSPQLIEVLKGKNNVTSTLRSMGYKHIRMGPNQSFPQDCSGLEDICLYKINEINGTAYGHGNIYIHVLSMSPILKVIRYFNLFNDYTNPNLYDKSSINDASRSISQRSSEFNGPLFFEINVWQPHAPYLFDDNCSRRSKVIVGFDAWEDSSISPYIDEIKCANKQLEEFVTNISLEDEDAIVIIMSDHGHSFFFDDRDVFVEEYDDEAMRARLANLVSAKLPKHCSNYLYSSISPVNIFPIVFSCLTNQEPELLEDLSYKHQLGNIYESNDMILVNTNDGK